MPRPTDAQLRWLRRPGDDGWLRSGDAVVATRHSCERHGWTTAAFDSTRPFPWGFRITPKGRDAVAQADEEGRK